MAKANQDKFVRGAIKVALKLCRGLPDTYRPSAFGPILSFYLLQGEASPARATRASGEAKGKTKAAKANDRPSRPKKVEEMIRSGYFKKGKTLADIRRELRARGFPTPVTSMPALLMPFVMNNKLERKLEKRAGKEQFVYYS
jgi:hypothetical protein